MTVADVASVIAAGAAAAGLGVSSWIAWRQGNQKAQLARQKWVRDNLTTEYTAIYGAVELFVLSCRSGTPDFNVMIAVDNTINTFIAKVPASLSTLTSTLRSQTRVVDYYLLAPENASLRETLGSPRDAIEGLDKLLTVFGTSFRQEAGIT
jgi:hypothetical protein